MNQLIVSLSMSDWLDLCALHEAVRTIAVKNLGSDPLSYSKMSRITNDIENQVTKGMAENLTLLLSKSSDKD